MARFVWSVALLTVLAGVLVSALAAAPTDPPFPLQINFPAGHAAEGIAMQGSTFWAPNTGTGGVIKGNVETGVIDPNFIPASLATPSLSHRSALGATVDSHNRLWVAGNLGSNVTGPPASVTKGCLFVYNAATGAPLAVYKITDATSRTMNDMVVTDTAVWVADTSAPNGAGTEVQHVLMLGPGGSLPPGGEIDPVTLLPLDPSAGPDAVDVPTPGFISSDGIDVLPNGSIAMTSVSGNDGRIIVIDPDTWKVTDVAVTTPNEPGRPASLPPLLSGDGVAMNGNVMYYPENRGIAATCPAPNTNLICSGSVAVVVFDPATNYTTAKVVARLSTPASLPPMRSPPNLERFGSRIYAMPQDAAGARYIAQIDSNPPNVSSLLVSQAEGGPAFSGPVATVIDPTAATSAGLTATIDWGDGSPVSTGTVTGSAGVFTVSSGHNYTWNAAGSPQPNANPFVTVTFTDTPAGQTRSSVRAAVLSGAAINATAPTISAAAGASAAWSSTFTDTGIAGVASNYTATIVWGDGTTNTTCTSASATCPIAASGGGYTVTTTHTFTRSGTYAPRITVTDTRGGTGAATGSATISGPAEVPLVLTVNARPRPVPPGSPPGTLPENAVEGTNITGAAATFTDPNATLPTLRLANQFTATIAWGDGTPDTAGAIALNATTGVYTVSGNHIYKEGTYTITVTAVATPTGTTATGSAPAVISDADTTPLPPPPAPGAQPLASPPLKTVTGGMTLSGAEGASISGLLAKFSDPRNAYGDPSQFVATVNWGDGSAPSTGVVTQLSYTRYTVGGSHAYAHKGTYTASVTINDAGGSPLTTTSTVTVADAAFTVAGTTISGVEGVPLTAGVATIHDANTLGSAADFTATIDWGDGTPTSAGTVTGTAGNYTVNGTHTYATAVPGGTYTVTVHVTSVGGSSADATTTAIIAFATGCIAAGDVHADAEFLMPGSKKKIHFDLHADCHEHHGHHGAPDTVDLQNAHAKVHQGGLKIVDAKTGGKNDEITTVKIEGSKATIVGTDNGNTFVIVVTDGGKHKLGLDTVWMVVRNASGAVIFDTTTLSAKHSPDVHVHEK